MGYAINVSVPHTSSGTPLHPSYLAEVSAKLNTLLEPFEFGPAMALQEFADWCFGDDDHGNLSVGTARDLSVADLLALCEEENDVLISPDVKRAVREMMFKNDAGEYVFKAISVTP